MHNLSLYHGDIIRAFQRHVPGSYVRDYRDRGGYITICRYYRDIRWKDQLTGGNVYRQVPAITLMNLPKGNVTPSSLFKGLALDRPGWRLEFRRASRHLTEKQMLAITEELGVDEIFPGIVSRSN